MTKNSVVTLEYYIEDLQHNILDSGEESLIYLHGGYNDIFPKLEQALEGKKVGDTITVQLTPKESFGEYDNELVSMEDRSEFDDNLCVGEQFIVSMDDSDDEAQKISYTVTDIKEDKVTLDGNHPLAGLEVVFYATVLDIRKATAQEIKEKHAH
ncbi:MAG: FKBP-type peptidyl-prolyl cis-trans isomerase [Campylobacteraceae bacterium]|nr:FKBP-type peptidyl-prolyl cis-trans isomerase [Campylobacteraceae bacterium]